jgi:serine/threonine protein kinase
MITEYMPGGSLFDLIHKTENSSKLLTEERILNICEDVALGMNYLHSRKVLHCDLKSSNVLVYNN